jgi:hypothetical protein
MTWRRLRVIIQGLPPESRTMTALRNTMSEADLVEQADRGEPEKGRWSQLEQLVAALVDSSRRLEYLLVAVNSDGKHKLPDPPEPLRRPGASARGPRKRISKANADRLFTLINGGNQGSG